MAIFRLILLVALMGGLALLLAQNWSPVLSLVFLGMQTISLPLAMWILFSTAAGAATSLLISGLFQLSSYFAAPQRPTPSASKPRRTPRSGDRPPSPPKAEPAYTYTSPPRSETKTSSQSSAVDDWETDNLNNDWDFEEKAYRESTPPPQDTQVRDSIGDSKTYERQQEPKTTFQSGSSYSYSYREPKNSGVGKTESVYDADYRVIIPPYQPPTDNQIEEDNQEDNQTDEDDWGFLEDFEDEDKDKRSRK
ncbi:MAG: LapA family protein [Fischerella sp.]|jgi:hypothetical protein|uniref:LapA family protein n=1 Tax=unclassified Fischerella TaxID=494603 RepID=UPI00047B560B|nr:MULTISPECIES: LapA family protein [unclassified Fischerella]NWF58588.1 LapA family protein [Fischerella sp.]